MPILNITCQKLDQEKKNSFAAEVSACIVETINASLDTVKVFFNTLNEEDLFAAGQAVINRDIFQVTLSILEGRTSTQLESCVRVLTNIAIRIFDLKSEDVHIFICEMPKNRYSVAGKFKG